MGLDVYLSKCPDIKAAEAAQDAAEKEVEALWSKAGKYDSLSESTKNEVRAECAKVYARFGCTGKHDRHASIVTLDDMPSTTAPEHMFKLGYFRSSYNGAGINAVMRKLNLLDLAGIFGVTNDEYNVVPDWSASLDRVNQTIDAYSTHLSSDAGRFRVMDIRPMFDMGVKNEAEALDCFMKHLRERSPDGDFNSFSNANGNFWLDGIKVHAIVTKKYERTAHGDVIGALINGPAVFMVYEQETKAGEEDWYLTALKIVRESIEYVLAQPDKQHFYMAWSG